MTIRTLRAVLVYPVRLPNPLSTLRSAIRRIPSEKVCAWTVDVLRDLERWLPVFIIVSYVFYAAGTLWVSLILEEFKFGKVDLFMTGGCIAALQLLNLIERRRSNNQKAGP